MPTAYLIPGESDTAAHPVARELIIGRGEQVDLLLDDITVSRRHAAVRPDGRTVVVTDLDSANGTYVNEERVFDGTRAADGDVIHFGSVKVRVRVDARDPDEPTPTPTEILRTP